MQYAGDTNDQDILSQIDFYCATNSTDYSVNDKTRHVNNAYHDAAQIIQSADGEWQWDDANNTTLPFGTTNLVSGQRDYTVDDAMLEIERVEAKDAAGNWLLLKPIDQSQIQQPYLSYDATTGTPEFYDKVGSSIYLFPGANYNSTNGLRIQFKRGASIFDVTDTTKTPGFAARFHDYLALSASLTYCMIYKQDRVQVLAQAKNLMKEEMLRYYGRRSKDTPQRMTPKLHNTR